MTHRPLTVQEEAIEQVLAQASSLSVIAETLRSRARHQLADNMQALADELEVMVEVYGDHLGAESGTGSRSDG